MQIQPKPIKSQRVEWMSQEQAAQRLELSARRVMEYANAGQIRTKKAENPETKRRVVMMHAGDVERLIDEREAKRAGVTDRAIATVEGPRREADDDSALSVLTAALALATTKQIPAAAAQLRPWLTLAEAAEYSGLPAPVLASLIEKGSLPALDVGRRKGGRYRLRRVDIDSIPAESQASNGRFANAR